MKYERNGNLHISTCTACGHQFIEIIVDNNIETVGKPFIELKERAYFSEEREFYEPINRDQVKYACPECGIIQISV